MAGEWRSELWHAWRANVGLTSFCLGAFKDAAWLRLNHPRGHSRDRARDILCLDSPSRCLLLLASLAALRLLTAFLSPAMTKERARIVQGS